MAGKMKDVLFGIVYVMTEGLAFDSSASAIRKVYFFLLVDVVQVLRGMTSTTYGWTDATKQLMSFSDVVYIFSFLSTSVVPRYTFFILGVLLVSVAVADTWYVGKLFQSGIVHKLWPVKLLRFTVSSIVTIFFSSVIKWLLVPVECLVLSNSDEAFSTYFHGPGAACTPFAMPEVLITVPTLVLAAIYIVFSMVTSYLSFEINPLSQQPSALFTGRVEASFQSFKIAAVLLVYLAQYLTPITITAVLMFFSFWVMKNHVLVLPFHNPTTNNVRGGIIGLVVWWSIASFGMSIIFFSSGGKHPGWLQNVQWVCVAFLPLGFLAGFIITRLQQASITTTIEMLKGDWEAAKAQAAYESIRDKWDSASELGAHQTTIRTAQAPKRTVFEKFFDTSTAHRTGTGEEWSRRFRFASALRAVTVTRELLYRRDPEGLQFLEFVITKAMEEWPESNNVMMLNLLLLRFVNRRWSEAGALERQMRLSLRSLSTDHQYTLHVVERKSTQDAAGTSKMGARGQVSALSLMEFEVGMDKAKKAHKTCLTTMRSFWKLAGKRKESAQLDALLRDLLKVLETNDKALACAKREYQMLLEKYPTSTELHHSYASFCDSALNNSRDAEKHRTEARSLEGDHGDDNAIGGKKDSESVVFQEGQEGTGTSVTSSESHRMLVAKSLVAFTDDIMGEEVDAIKVLKFRVRTGLMLLVVIATIGFLITDLYLFSDVAQRNLDLIDSTGIFRSFAMSAAYLTRTQMIHAHLGHADKVADAKQAIYDVMQRLRNEHLSNYEGLQQPRILGFYLANNKKLHVPFGAKWRVMPGNYWGLTNEFTQRVERAASASMEELNSPDWTPGKMSEEKTQMTFLHENLNRIIIPMLEELVDLYESEVDAFGGLTVFVVWLIAGINFMVTVVLFLLIMRGLRYVMQTMHYHHFACVMALQLPPKITHIFDKFYRDQDMKMRALDDEEMQEQEILQEGGGEPPETTAIGDEADSTPERRNSPIDQFMLLMHVVPTGKDYKARVEDWETQSSLQSREPSGDVSVHDVVNGATSPQQHPVLTSPKNAGGMRSDLTKQEDGGFARKAVKTLEVDGGTLSESLLLAPVLKVDDLGSSPEAARPKFKVDDLGSSPEAARPKFKAAGGAKERGAIPHFMMGSSEEGKTSADESGDDLPADLMWVAGDVALDDENPLGASLQSPNPMEATLPKPQISRVQDLAFSSKARSRSKSPMSALRASRPLDEKWSGPTPLRANTTIRRASIEANGELGEKEKEASTKPSMAGTEAPPRGISSAAKRTGFGENLNPGTSWTAFDKLMGKREPQYPATFTTRSGQTERFVSPAEYREMSVDMLGSLRLLVSNRNSWFNQTRVYLLAFAIVCVCSGVSMGIPGQRVPSLVNMAPSLNQAGRRRFLTRACVHYTRELVLADGFSRLGAEGNAAALRFYLRELVDADYAIRLGGKKGISVGSDFRSIGGHNRAMYKQGCPWRANTSDCSTPEREGVASNGINFLFGTFVKAVETVLLRYDPTKSVPDVMDLSFQEDQGVDNIQEWNPVNVDKAKLALLDTDREVKWILGNFDGDMNKAFGMVLTLFHDESVEIIVQVHLETRLLFAVYIMSIIGMLYILLFRRTCNSSMAQATLSREFVIMMPIYILTNEDANMVIQFYSPDHDTEDGKGEGSSHDQYPPTPKAQTSEDRKRSISQKMPDIDASERRRSTPKIIEIDASERRRRTLKIIDIDASERRRSTPKIIEIDTSERQKKTRTRHQTREPRNTRNCPRVAGSAGGNHGDGGGSSA